MKPAIDRFLCQSVDERADFVSSKRSLCALAEEIEQLQAKLSAKASATASAMAGASV